MTTAALVKKAYDRGEMSVEAALHMMATLYQKSEYSDPDVRDAYYSQRIVM